MLSNLTKLLDKSFIVGFLLPTVLFVVAACYTLGTPDILQSMLTEHGVETGSAALLVGGVWLLATLLMSFNLFSYRLLEGYLYPLKWYRRGKRKASERIKTLREESECLRLQIVAETSAPDGKRNEDRLKALRRKRLPKMEELAALPLDPDVVLPTAFGNAIRAFERYPNEVYGADGVLLWYRLAPLVPKTLLDNVVESRSVVDFMVSGTMLSAILGLAIFGHIVAATANMTLAAVQVTGNWGQVVTAVSFGDAWHCIACVAASVVFYRLALLLVPDWGEAVKACYDVGLPELATKLGYRLPETSQQREAFWLAVSRTVGFTKNSNGDLFLKPEQWEQIGKNAEARATRPGAAVRADTNEGVGDEAEECDDGEDEGTGEKGFH